MNWANQSHHYGIVQQVLHWTLAIAIIALFALGLWMVNLNYFSPYYRSAPDLHRSIGVLVVTAMMIRLAWKAVNPKVIPLSSHRSWEKWLAGLIHSLFYLLVLALGISGYMITTANGQPLHVFNWFSLPAIDFGIRYQEDIAGDLHEVLAWSLMALAGLHFLGALKHQFIDRDNTLSRMLPFVKQKQHN
ncbi:cytochrome b [Thiomicrospira sp. ALE5]|uniref:cytochrome b n=1 Tax=Thiomicrospira sp. ALE5 TaxID=748650 RepID=UPI0008E48791|nr:cytochrome b [Thiomicrospira sp. ALE5]SFR56137.1 cytochrome b561 [Thiomicrospira sp. ALE5]